MGKIATRSRRRGAFTPSRYLVLAASAFLGVNLYFFLRHSAIAPGQAAGSGEGSHRYRQTEQHEEAAAAAVVEQQAQQQAERQQGGGAGGTADRCHAEADAEYEGEKVVQWGDKHYKDSAAECCATCLARASDGCNVWVYCDKESGCSGKRTHKECWLKKKNDLYPLEPKARRAPGSGWVSGAVYSEEEKAAALRRHEEVANHEKNYLEDLRANESLPLVYLDVEIKKKPVGRIEMVLFPNISPRSAENFRQLCTGESGEVPNEPGREGAGLKRHFKGHYFYRIIDQFIDQTGVETESVFGGQFKDDPGGLKLKHERKGLLSMANMGPNTNTAHFSIMMGPAHHLDGSYTIFGQVVRGFDVVDAINALSKGKPDNTATQEDGAQIVDSGQLRKGSIVPDLTLGL